MVKLGLTRGASRSSNRKWLFVSFLVALGLGAATVVLVADRALLEVRQPPVEQAAAADPSVVPPPGASDTDGDSRIQWMELSSSTGAPVVADGRCAWVAVVESFDAGRPAASVLHRYDPQTNSLVRVASIEGRPTAAIFAGEEVAIGAKNLIHLVHRTTHEVRTIALPESPGAAEGSVRHVTALAHAPNRLFATLSGSTQIFEIELESGHVQGTLDVSAYMPPPTALVWLDGRTLLASTPFGTQETPEPGSALLDIDSGAVENVDLGRPFSFSSAGSVLLATQAVPGGGVVEIVKAPGTLSASIAPSALGRNVPWVGRWDLLATDGDAATIWAASLASDRIFRVHVNGTTESYALPIRTIIPSIPQGTKLTEEEYADLSTIVRRPTSMATLADGSLVFFVENGGGALGYIANP